MRRSGALVVVSSQLPVGSAATLERRMTDAGRDDLRLRLRARESAARAGTRDVPLPRPVRRRRALRRGSRPTGGRCSTAFGARVEWMGVESAEMTKHALNAFLATSVAFINEVAAICESVGADAVRRRPWPEERAAHRAARLPRARRRLRRRDPGARHPLPQRAGADAGSPGRGGREASPPATPSIATGHVAP